MTTTQEVLAHHLKCFAEGDLDGILSDYAAGAVLFTPEGLLKGHAAIGRLFQGIFAEFGKPGTSFRMKQQLVDGDYAYLVWMADTPDNTYELATDTFAVRNGKIVAQSFAAKTASKA